MQGFFGDLIKVLCSNCEAHREEFFSLSPAPRIEAEILCECKDWSE